MWSSHGSLSCLSAPKWTPLSHCGMTDSGRTSCCQEHLYGIDTCVGTGDESCGLRWRSSWMWKLNWLSTATQTPPPPSSEAARSACYPPLPCSTPPPCSPQPLREVTHLQAPASLSSACSKALGSLPTWLQTQNRRCRIAKPSAYPYRYGHSLLKKQRLNKQHSPYTLAHIACLCC